MSTGPTTLPKKGPQERAARRRLLPRLRDARIRSKLALILVVPVAAVLALATVRLLDVGREAYQADLIRSLTSLSTDISALTQDIHQERMAAVNLLAAPSSKPDAYNLHVRRTDERIAAYNADRRKLGDVPAAVRERLRAIDDHLATLNTTRQEVLDRKQMPVSEAVLRYGVVLTDLVSYGDALGQVSGGRRRRGKPPGGCRVRAGQVGYRGAAGGGLHRALRQPPRRGTVLRVRGDPDQPAGGAAGLLAGRHPRAAGTGGEGGQRRRGGAGRPGGRRCEPDRSATARWSPRWTPQPRWAPLPT